MKNLLCLAVICLSYCYVHSAATGATTTSTAAPATTKNPTTKPATQPPSSSPKATSPPTAPTTTLKPAEQCMNANSSCDACVKVGKVQCVWCQSTKSCMLKEHVIPTSECSLADAKWAVCWLNYEALIIACSVIGGLLILGLTICICCCCCCRGNKNAKYAKDDAKYERKKAEMKVKHEERRADRKAKNDEIRRKYGLIKEDNPYTRFDDK